MTAKEKKKLLAFLHDIVGFIQLKVNTGQEDEILHHLGHDINAWVNKVPGFTPRVSGYAAEWKKCE